jgi:EAL domain-containing protein (putative c-di-GMP-specific phosphodiesterase class I)
VSICESQEDIVETIKIFADKQGLKTVAEFVSSKEVFDAVSNIGLDFVQGYYVGEPQATLATEVLNPEDFN